MKPTRLTTVQSLLSDEYKRRKTKNAQYSVRAFAASLGIGKSSVGRILNGTHVAGPVLSRKIRTQLGGSVDSTNSVLKTEENRHRPQAYQKISTSYFWLLERWYYIPMLTQARSNGLSPNAEVVASLFDIDLSDAIMALDRLKKTQLITLDAKGIYRRSGVRFEFQAPGDSDAIRRYHEKNLTLAQRQIQQLSRLQRIVSSVCFSLDSEILPEYETEVLSFLKRLGAMTRSPSNQQSKLYMAAVQIFRSR